MQTNIYLDIDGVLLVNDNTPSNYSHEFLEYVTSHFPTFWLTTHCRGDATVTIERMRPFFPEKTINLMERIQPTNWDIAKTDAIDFSKPWLWFDDDLYEDEREVLIKHGALDNWIEVDLMKNVNQLHNFLISFPIPTPYTTQTPKS